MTYLERVIVSAYTGYLMCDFPDMHKYIEDKLGRPVWTHEMAGKAMQEEIRKAVYPDFIALCGHKDGGQDDAIEELDKLLDGVSADNDSLCEKIERMVIAGKRRWIPVTERCPEKSGDYLVFDDCRNLYVNEWHCLLKKWQYDDSRITHWMPLPEPPKEEE